MGDSIEIFAKQWIFENRDYIPEQGIQKVFGMAQLVLDTIQGSFVKYKRLTKIWPNYGKEITATTKTPRPITRIVCQAEANAKSKLK